MKSTLREIIEWLICIIIAVALALLVRYYIGTPTIVQHILNAIDTAYRRIRANVNFDLTMEMLALTIKENIR